VQGVTPEYVRELQAAGLKVDADDIVALKVQRVTAAYVKGLRDQGLNRGLDDVIGMRVQGVTPEYIRDIRAWIESERGRNRRNESAGSLHRITSRRCSRRDSSLTSTSDRREGAGISPEFIEAARKHGFQNLTIDKLIELKHLGILDQQRDI